MTTYTTLTDLAAAVRDLRPDAVDLITDKRVRCALQRLRIAYGEVTDADDLDHIATIVINFALGSQA